MSTVFIIRTVIELAAILFVIYGVLHEQKFIDFEDKIILKFKKKHHKNTTKKRVPKNEIGIKEYDEILNLIK